MIMLYTDLLLLLASVMVLYKCWRFTKEVALHVNNLKSSTNRVRERIHLYSHIWIVASGLIAIVSCTVIQCLHIYYQDIIHDDSMVVWLEHWMNITVSLVFIAYGNALNHFRAEERVDSQVTYYSVRPHDDRNGD